MASEILSLRLVGIAGLSRGKEFLIEEGGEAVIGRSRSCQFRIDSRPADDEPTAHKPLKGSAGNQTHLLTVSGRHVKLSFRSATQVEITDLSKHGTFINGRRIEGSDRLLGLEKAPVEMRLGTNETFRLEFARTPARAKPRISVKRRV